MPNLQYLMMEAARTKKIHEERQAQMREALVIPGSFQDIRALVATVRAAKAQAEKVQKALDQALNNPDGEARHRR